MIRFMGSSVADPHRCAAEFQGSDRYPSAQAIRTVTGIDLTDETRRILPGAPRPLVAVTEPIDLLAKGPSRGLAASRSVATPNEPKHDNSYNARTDAGNHQVDSCSPQEPWQ